MLRSFKETENKRHDMDSSISIITQAEPELIQSDDSSDSSRHLLSLNGESSSIKKGKLWNSSSSIDHLKSFGLAIEKCGEFDFKVIQLDPRKLVKLEMSETDIRKFVATWKNECSTHSLKKV
jgi:hypothetical protein